MSSVETLDRWLSKCPRPAESVPSVMVNLPPDGEMDRELLRAAPRDTFVVILGGPIPPALLPNIHDAGLDPEEYRCFGLDAVAENGVSGREPEEGFHMASRDSREEGG
ncbi:MAG: hypothetical protein H0X71_09470 [Rubrobacter sp.]|nr:hypothetical protein [Rubrobacter sp.]